MEIISGIYCIQNNKNGKIYIGQSNNIYYRWSQEKKGNINKIFKDDVEFFGIENFSFYILERCDVNNLSVREMFYIKLYHSYDREFGYNISLGGKFNRNRIRSEWERKQLRKETTKRYREKHKEEIDNKRKEKAEEIKKYFKKYNKKRKDDIKYIQACEKAQNNLKELRKQMCKDPIKQDIITYACLQGRKNRNKELYKNIILKNCLIAKGENK